MIPRGGQSLIAKRLEGWIPKTPVLINYGDFREPGTRSDAPLAITDWAKWKETSGRPELLVLPEDPIDRLDFRCVAGLDVLLFFVFWNESVARLYEILQNYAAEIAVQSPCFDEDIGWYWLRKYGQVEINDRHWVTRYEQARAACSAASSMAGDKGKEEYAKAQEDEMECLRRAPWLRGKKEEKHG